MKRIGLIRILLCVVLLLVCVICPMVTKAEEAVVAEDVTSSEVFVTAQYDVSEYRASTPYTYPKKAGYIFAGWYTDEACTEDAVFTGTSGPAYAKFVDSDILGVRCQITKDTKSTALTTDLRIVTSVGSNMYGKVGFKVDFEGKEPFYTSIDTVYKTVDGWVNGSNKSYAPYKLFSIGSKYLAGCTILNFPNADFDKNITITARWKTLDGTTVEGSMKRFSINDVIKAFDYDESDTTDRTQKVAKVGEEYFATFAAAVDAANKSTEDVKIKLLRDVTIDVATKDVAIVINNEKGKNITIDGCGYKLDVISTKHAIRIHQTSGTVTIQNCNIEHSGENMLMRIGDNSYTDGDTAYDVTFQLRDVNIASTGTYEWCLIGTQDQGDFDLNMTNVTVDWIHADNINQERAFIRCGGSGYTQTVNLNMTGSTIDVSDAALTQGLYILTTVTGNNSKIKFENTNITTADGVATYYNRGSATVQNDQWNSSEVNRVVVLSDTHYSTNNIMLSSVAGPILGYDQSDRIALALADVTKLQTETGNLNAVMVLGDLSTDDYGYRNLSENYVEKFKEDFMDKLSVNCYALAGNHDSYTNTQWNSIFGYNREYVVEIEGAKFIMLDTYEAENAVGASGSAYRGMDETNREFLETELKKEFDGPVFLCAHWFGTSFDGDFQELLNQYPNVVCLFHGHSHVNSVSKSVNTSNKYLVNSGGYAYDPNPDENGVFDYSRFDIKYAWGYQVLEWNGTAVRTYHVKPARSYTDSSGTIHTIENTLKEDELLIQYDNE